MADKARYYLEQSVPELKEFEKQKIFTKVFTPYEISAKHLLIALRRRYQRFQRRGQNLSIKSILQGASP